MVLDGEPVMLLCSNNYLGLADHPRVREGAAEAAMRWGVGAGASRLVSGTMTIHRHLEERLATFEGSEACVLFGSGYLANMGVIGALAGPGDTIFSDELNHASIIDGCRASRARVIVYRHLDMDHLGRCMSEHRGTGRRLIVTDSVFSMDGDVAPLLEIADLADRHDARVVVDEAHATGALGEGGRGALAEAGLQGRADVLIGTLGKALGSYGAYACAQEEMVRYLINRCPPIDLLDRSLSTIGGRRFGGTGAARSRSRSGWRALHDAARCLLERRSPRKALPSSAVRCTSCRWSSVRAGRRCACVRPRWSEACSPRRSAPRPWRRALQGCAWR